MTKNNENDTIKTIKYYLKYMKAKKNETTNNFIT